MAVEEARAKVELAGNKLQAVFKRLEQTFSNTSDINPAEGSLDRQVATLYNAWKKF